MLKGIGLGIAGFWGMVVGFQGLGFGDMGLGFRV